MLAGRPAQEALLVSLSAQLEDARPWADRRPPGLGLTEVRRGAAVSDRPGFATVSP